jgi:hypothetical protein
VNLRWRWKSHFKIDLIALGKSQRQMVNGCNSNVNKIKSNSLKERTVYEKRLIEIWKAGSVPYS